MQNGGGARCVDLMTVSRRLLTWLNGEEALVGAKRGDLDRPQGEGLPALLVLTVYSFCWGKNKVCSRSRGRGEC